MSTVDALWVLIQSQSKRVRQALAKRIFAELSEQQEQRDACIDAAEGCD